MIMVGSVIRAVVLVHRVHETCSRGGCGLDVGFGFNSGVESSCVCSKVRTE